MFMTNAKNAFHWSLNDNLWGWEQKLTQTADLRWLRLTRVTFTVDQHRSSLFTLTLVSSIDSLSFTSFWSSILHKQFKVPSRWIDNFTYFLKYEFENGWCRKSLPVKKKVCIERQKSYILRQKGSKLHSIIYHCYLHPVTSSCQFDTIQYCYPYPYIDKYDYHYNIALYDI